MIHTPETWVCEDREPDKQRFQDLWSASSNRPLLVTSLPEDGSVDFAHWVEEWLGTQGTTTFHYCFRYLESLDSNRFALTLAQKVLPGAPLAALTRGRGATVSRLAEDAIGDVLSHNQVGHDICVSIEHLNINVSKPDGDATHLIDAVVEHVAAAQNPVMLFSGLALTPRQVPTDEVLGSALDVARRTTAKQVWIAEGNWATSLGVASTDVQSLQHELALEGFPELDSAHGVVLKALGVERLSYEQALAGVKAVRF